jgi:hypothetical protein
MMGRHDAHSVNLPEQPSPIPDAVTGLPRPPRAPREWQGYNPTPVDHEPRNPPPDPDDLGQRLEWNQHSRRDMRVADLGIIALFAGFATWRAGGLAWMTWWWAWLVLGLWLAHGWWFSRHGNWLSAGAVWVQQDENWVNTYELTRIRFTVSGLNRVLKLTDSSGRNIHGLVIRSVQSNQPMWDLVYNGILYSVASGNCDISDKARAVLKVPADLGMPPTEDRSE